MSGSKDDATIRSMTSFASLEGAISGWNWTIEIRGVNGKTLDIRLRLPDIEGLEAALRQRLQSALGRGNVTASIKMQRDDTAPVSNLDPDALAATIEIIGKIEAAASLKGVTLAPCSASDIANFRGVIDYSEDAAAKDTAVLKSAVIESFEKALAAFVSERRREGTALAHVLQDQIARIETLIGDAETAIGAREEAQRSAMERALEKVLAASDGIDEGRLLQELALIAVKTDVTEEIDRLKAHVGAARELLQVSGPVGRKLDFLMQEFNREANTLCSKSQSSALTAIGLDLKTLIDQMREQVQNIE